MNELLESIVMRLQAVFDPQVLGERIVDFTINLIVALVTFAAFYLAWLLVSVLLNLFERRSSWDKTSQAFLRTILKYSILLAGLFNALSTMGVDTAGLLASLGIVGITIGFAARDSFSNLISGILIFLDRPFVIGDLVDGVNHYPGQDKELNILSCRGQYKKFEELVKLIRSDIEMVICPGNHDAVWVGDPQPIISDKWAPGLY